MTQQCRRLCLCDDAIIIRPDLLHHASVQQGEALLLLLESPISVDVRALSSSAAVRLVALRDCRRR